MCGRFFIEPEGEDALLSMMIEEAARRQKAIVGQDTVARGEVRPSDTAAALAMGRSGQVGAFPMKWGFHRQDGGLIINTRSETALTLPLFRPSMLERRCLIPASWYYEWETVQLQPGAAARDASGGLRRVRYAIRPAAPGPIYLAGIYRYEEGSRLPVFSVLTRAPAPEIAFIHDRMPVIFSENARSLWLDSAADPLSALEACEKAAAYQPA